MFKGVTALVTGGASGLGKATVERLSRQGANVILADLPSSDGEKVAKKLLNVKFAPVDVTKETDVQSAINEASDKLKNLRIVVNCAGIAVGKRTLDIKRGAAHPLSDFQKVLQINTVGTFNVARLASVSMWKNEPDSEGCRGVIVNTASIAAYDGQIGQCAYSASKGAVTAMTLPMARDLGAAGIRVVTIAPGLFETPMLEGIPPAAINNLVQYCSFPSRAGRSDEFAHLVEHIYQNQMLNGCVIRLDAGLRMPA